MEVYGGRTAKKETDIQSMELIYPWNQSTFGGVR